MGVALTHKLAVSAFIKLRQRCSTYVGYYYY